jgi:hypothetical protein
VIAIDSWVVVRRTCEHVLVVEIHHS